MLIASVFQFCPVFCIYIAISQSSHRVCGIEGVEVKVKHIRYLVALALCGLLTERNRKLFLQLLCVIYEIIEKIMSRSLNDRFGVTCFVVYTPLGVQRAMQNCYLRVIQSHFGVLYYGS